MSGRFSDVVRARNGEARRGIPVTVFVHGQVDPAVLFRDIDGTIIADNPTYSDGDTGQIAFFADPGLYDFYVDGVIYAEQVPIIDGAGGSGTFISTTIVDFKGDLIVAVADDNPQRFGVGADGTVLTADSSQTAGVRWSTNGSGDVSGPASATDNAITRFDGLTGKLVQNSTITVSDVGIVTLPSQGSPPATADGQLFYDATTRTLNFDNDDLNVRMPIGRQVWVEVHNDSAFVLTKGMVVHIDGAQVGSPFLPTVEPSLANNEFTNQSIGLVLETIPIGQNGFVLTSGLMTGVNTSGLIASRYVYVSTTTPGAFTASVPHAPNFETIVGVASRIDALDGSILVFPSHTELGLGGSNQVRGMIFGGADEEYKTLQGTADRLTVTHGVGTVTFDVSNTLMDTKQPIDADLTAIAGLTPSNDDLIQRKAGSWTNRTPAQVKTDLALTKSDVGLGNVDNTSDADKPVSTATQAALDAKVTGPASATDNAVTRYDSTTGKLVQNSLVTISDLGIVTLPNQGGFFPPTPEGSLVYGRPEIFIINDESEIVLPIGSQVRMNVRNTTGSTITKFQTVYVSGFDTVNFLPLVSLARADVESTSECIGVALHDIENNTDGWVLTEGVFFSPTATGGLTVGAPYYLSETTAGGFTGTKPAAPNLAVQLGIVARTSGGGINLSVRPEKPELGTAVNGQVEISRSTADGGTAAVFHHQLASVPRTAGEIPAGGVVVARASTTMTLNLMHLIPFAIIKDATLTLVTFEVTANVATAVARAGIYAADPSTFLPTGSPVVDYGTVSAATIGTPDFTVSTGLTAGVWYLAFVGQTAAPTLRFGSGFTPYVQRAGFPSGTDAGWHNSWIQSGVSGALPAIGALTTADAPIIALSF